MVRIIYEFRSAWLAIAAHVEVCWLFFLIPSLNDRIVSISTDCQCAGPFCWRMRHRLANSEAVQGTGDRKGFMAPAQMQWFGCGLVLHSAWDIWDDHCILCCETTRSHWQLTVDCWFAMICPFLCSCACLLFDASVCQSIIWTRKLPPNWTAFFLTAPFAT